MSQAESPALPPLYDRWVSQLLGDSIPGEAPSTCSDCAMCAPAGQAYDEALYFRPDTKCCTYLPRMWNFLAGGVLSDDSAEAGPGRATLEARLDAGVAVTPLGLDQTPMFEHLYGQARNSFGRVESLRCPHYLEEAGGLCGVWRHRESTCATWFCKHDRGEVGEKFFDALHWMLVAAEKALARWVILELDIGTEALGLVLPYPQRAVPVMTPNDFAGVIDPVAYRRIWGAWAGREREFYREAARRVARLGWSEIRQIGGADLQAHERLVAAAYRNFRSTALPARTRFTQLTLERVGLTTTQIGTYRHTDSLSVPNELLGVLPRFDGRDTLQTMAEIEAEERISLEPGLVRRLVDFGVLKEKQ